MRMAKPEAPRPVARLTVARHGLKLQRRKSVRRLSSNLVRLGGMWLSFPLLSLAYAREVVSNGIARLPRLHVLAALGRHARSPLLLLLTLGLACACAAKPPRLQPHAVIVSQVTPQSIQLTLDLEVFNDNSFPLIAQRV